jgi:hypothetical protein
MYRRGPQRPTLSEIEGRILSLDELELATSVKCAILTDLKQEHTCNGLEARKDSIRGFQT